MARGGRFGVGAVVVLVGAGALTACARPVQTDPAPSASEPVCADVLQASPEELGGQERRSTTSQASRAWGDPAITLRCGVDPLPPTDEPCLVVTAQDGTEVGWVAVETDEGSRFTTYGLLPAVEVDIPAAYAGDSTILTDLTEAVAGLPRDGDRECL